MRMCAEYPTACVKNTVFPLIQPEGGKGRSYAEWKAEREGKPTWRTAIRMDIKEAVEESFSWRQFIGVMEKKGYAFN